MKSVEKMLGFTLKDLENSLPTLKYALSKVTESYFEETHPKLQMLDIFLVFNVVLFIL